MINAAFFFSCNLESLSLIIVPFFCFDRPYAPCLLGFEGHGGNRTPTISGIVVHQHNETLLREAHVEMASNLLEQENENRQQMILKKWKRLLVGILVKDRLDRAYGGSTS